MRVPQLKVEARLIVSLEGVAGGPDGSTDAPCTLRGLREASELQAEAAERVDILLEPCAGVEASDAAVAEPRTGVEVPDRMEPPAGAEPGTEVEAPERPAADPPLPTVARGAL